MSVDPNRRARIQALVEHGATEGERAAARAALGRLDTAAAEAMADLERSVGFGWNPSQAAHDATERGSYYARDTLAGSGVPPPSPRGKVTLLRLLIMRQLHGFYVARRLTRSHPTRTTRVGLPTATIMTASSTTRDTRTMRAEGVPHERSAARDTLAGSTDE